MKINFRLLSETKPFRLFFILSISLGFAIGILGILQARQVAQLVNRVFLGDQDVTQVIGIFSSLLAIVLLRAGTMWGGEISASAGARRIKQSLRDRLYAHLAEIGPSILRGEGEESETLTGELINTAIDGIESLEVYFSQYLPQIALAALVPVSILVFVFPIDLLSGVVLLVTAPLIPLFMVLIGSTAESLTRKQWRGLSRMSAYFLDILQGLTTLKMLGRSREQGEVVSQVSERYRLTTMEVLRLTFASALALELIATLSTAVVAVEIGLRLLYGKLAFEQAFFILLLAPEFYAPLRQLGTRFHAGMAGVEASRKIFAILDTPSGDIEGVGNPQSTDTSGTSSEIPPTISFNDVNFKYSNDRLALDQVSFELPARKVTALVGESGAGKTTLAWILLRFLKHQSGEILVNGRHLEEISPEAWRRQVAWVPQDPHLFSDTISANIALSHPQATEADIIHAAQLAHADEFIQQLPGGYATQVGERGTRLSAGQAQRIALARAFLKNAPLVILDEATSHLDPELDAELQESINTLSHGRTVLVIAHRRSTLSSADQVVRLKTGKVIETRMNTAPIRPVSKEIKPRDGRATALSFNSGRPFASGRQADDPKAHPRVEWRLVRLVQPFASRIVLSILMGFATIASGVGLMGTAAYLISAAALHPSIAELQIAIVGVRFFGLSRGVFRYLERLVSHDVTFRLLARWRAWFYQALEPLAPARLLQYHSGDLLSRVIGDISALESFYVRAISPPMVACLVAVSSAIWIGSFDPRFAWVISGFFILAGLAVPILTTWLSRRAGAEINRKRAELSRLLVDGIQGLPDLLLNEAEGSQKKRISHAGTGLIALQGRMAGISALSNALENLLASLAMLTILIIASISVSQGKLDGVLLGVVALGALTSFEAMQSLPLAAQNLTLSRSAAERLYELVDATPAVSIPVPARDIPSAVNLEFKNLSFQYPAGPGAISTPGKDEFSLRDVSFSLPQGKHIALIGPSGAGKTTLVNLLLRFWDCPPGSILLEGFDLREFDPDVVRKRMAVISQNTYLFSATIKQNLLLARPNASGQELIQAAKAARLHDVIESTPEGYQTWIGEHGLRLSAGERQRLAIARAILKDAPVLILDEPTAHLDTQTEQEVLASIHEYTRGRSLINITQRMVGMESMDEILVLSNGQIIEQGTHADLISRRGQYFKMWSIYNQVI